MEEILNSVLALSLAVTISWCFSKIKEMEKELRENGEGEKNYWLFITTMLKVFSSILEKIISNMIDIISGIISVPYFVFGFIIKILKKILTQEKYFHTVCMIFIFVVLVICYYYNYITISEPKVAVIAIGSLVLTASDCIEKGLNKAKFIGRLFYMFGLTVVVIAPYIKELYIEVFNIGSVYTTLMGLILIFIMNIINVINTDKENAKWKKIKSEIGEYAIESQQFQKKLMKKNDVIIKGFIREVEEYKSYVEENPNESEVLEKANETIDNLKELLIDVTESDDNEK